jgi:hypothetical protein
MSGLRLAGTREGRVQVRVAAGGARSGLRWQAIGDIKGGIPAKRRGVVAPIYGAWTERQIPHCHH